MAKKYRDVWKLLRQAGWRQIRQSGSQVWQRHDGRIVIVPGGGHGNPEVPAGTLASIRKKTGIEELR